VDELRVRPRGRHFLAPRLAADLVRNSGVTRGDLVVEVGAGNGVITGELIDRARRVIAVELDERDANKLRRRFPRVRVVHADAREYRWPQEPFRVVANLPFAHTTEILRCMLDDPRSALLRADVVVGWGFAVKRCSMRPSSLLTTCWAPWFELTITRRIPASGFAPRPSVDAAVLTVTRRPDPLLPCGEFVPFQSFVRREFTNADRDPSEWVSLYTAKRSATGSSRRRSARRA
jgi:23S rRNA (adenine-N6)-dimethyltransferase